jgi:hypothetical protein
MRSIIGVSVGIAHLGTEQSPRVGQEEHCNVKTKKPDEGCVAFDCVNYTETRWSGATNPLCPEQQRPEMQFRP